MDVSFEATFGRRSRLFDPGSSGPQHFHFGPKMCEGLFRRRMRPLSSLILVGSVGEESLLRALALQLSVRGRRLR